MWVFVVSSSRITLGCIRPRLPFIRNSNSSPLTSCNLYQQFAKIFPSNNPIKPSSDRACKCPTNKKPDPCGIGFRWCGFAVIARGCCRSRRIRMTNHNNNNFGNQTVWCGNPRKVEGYRSAIRRSRIGTASARHRRTRTNTRNSC